jgi:hypothetical protein
MTIEPSDFPNGHEKMANSAKTIISFPSSNGLGQMVKVNRYFNSFNFQRISTTKGTEIVDIVMVKFGLTMKIL